MVTAEADLKGVVTEMSDRKVVMLVDSSLTYPKVMAEDAQAVLKRLEAYDAEVVYVQDQKDWDRSMFVEYASKVEKVGPEPFDVNEEFLKEAEDAEVIIANFAPVGSKIIENAKKLKLICVTRSGAENINIEAATAKGVKVAVAPGRLADPVSDYTVGMILAESRNIARMSITDHGGEWMTDAPNSSYIKSLKGATVGLIGYGIIGQRVAYKLQAFGCNIIAYDPFCPQEVFEATNCGSVSLEELMKTSDYVSVHARLTKDTEGLVTKEHINMMKPTAFFINTARAGLVDENALVEALAAHKIGGAALDVFSVEPIPEGHPILALDNVTLTPHRAGNCSNLAAISLDIVVEEIERYFKGKPLTHAKN